MKSAEDVLPRDRQREKYDDNCEHRALPARRDPSSRMHPECERKHGVQHGIRDRLQARIPLAVEQNQAEILQLGENDAMLIVRMEQVAEEVLLFEPRDQQLNGLRVPLIPVRHRRTVVIEGRPFGADDQQKQTDGESSGENALAHERWGMQTAQETPPTPEVFAAHSANGIASSRTTARRSPPVRIRNASASARARQLLCTRRIARTPFGF
jgi:hypothetical protein